MTYEEFLKSLEEFKSWVSKRTREPEHWYLSLEEWARGMYNDAYTANNTAKFQRTKEAT